eukprot:TRINITY_DN7157_c0_g1_i1.p1 TRINITY_DN7157_c0_g1~~TRINITY_DN7157_c0_g1_i1.p1  ORF type:complete len:109 (+),score=13.02 TRINITY_DN7157_c0_g1_i1:141-467(+)
MRLVRMSFQSADIKAVYAAVQSWNAALLAHKNQIYHASVFVIRAIRHTQASSRGLGQCLVQWKINAARASGMLMHQADQEPDKTLVLVPGGELRQDRCCDGSQECRIM